jgi:2-keto-3-deoxy-L-rhamnonate aldolase RhmA
VADQKMSDSNQAWESPVKKLLREGQTVVAATIMVNSVDVAAHAASMGFDFLWIEMEHSPITLETLRNIVLATRGMKALPFARVPVNEIWMAKRVLDAGVSGVIFPFTSTPELAAQAVAACRYPPAGRRGSGANLARFTWPDPTSYPDSADKNVVVIVIIEEARAVENVEAIAATPGIDIMFIGTSDLSFSLGLRGDQDHPRLQEAIEKVVAAAHKHGKVAGRPAATPELAQQYMAQGFRFFQAPTDLGFMAAGVRDYLAPFGKSTVKTKAKTIY